MASLVIVAAGTGRRLDAPVHKAWVMLGGRPLFWHAARRLRAVEGLEEIVLVLHPDDLALAVSSPGREWFAEVGIARVVAGGEDRQGSVAAGVRATRATSRNVLVHDAARPLVDPGRVRALLETLEREEAVFLGAPVRATVKRLDAAQRAVETLPREDLALAATPQGARRALLLDLLARAERAGQRFTDEAGLCAWGEVPVACVPDDPRNFKVTDPGDLSLAESLLGGGLPRIGHGYDIHRTTLGGRLVLGGVEIPSELGLDGHSDADAVLHALMDALLGAVGGTDIGEHFPPSDPAYAGVDSRELLKVVLGELEEKGQRPAQADINVIAERPRLGPHKAAIKASLVELLDLPEDRVSVKARSGEGLGPIGRAEAIEVHATVLVVARTP